MSSSLKAKLERALGSAVNSLRKFAYAVPAPAGAESPVLVRTRPRVGLALSGGFARGLAHIGVLKVLTNHGIPIDALAGTSVGSVVAAVFASGAGIEEMVRGARQIRWRNFARWTIARLGLATNARMEAMLRRALRCSRFEDLAIPLAVVATDLSTGEPVVFRKGDLIPPLRGSCSFPGLFTPVSYEGRLLVDGAICDNVPVDSLFDSDVDAILAVYLKTDGMGHTPSNMFQVLGQAFQIAQGRHQADWREHCDLVIEPDVSDFKWDDFGRADELVLEGERAALRALPEIRALLQTRTNRQARNLDLVGRHA